MNLITIKNIKKIYFYIKEAMCELAFWIFLILFVGTAGALISAVLFATCGMAAPFVLFFFWLWGDKDTYRRRRY